MKSKDKTRELFIQKSKIGLVLKDGTLLIRKSMNYSTNNRSAINQSNLNSVVGRTLSNI